MKAGIGLLWHSTSPQLGQYSSALDFTFGGPYLMNTMLLYFGALLPLIWGIAHLFPTRNVVKGFGDISVDNQRVVTMEWINEGATLIFIGLLVAIVTWLDPLSTVATAVYWVSILMLNALSVISLLTGFRIHFIFYRLCPLVFTGSSFFILAGMLLAR